jgi:hypothetical protein
MNGPLKLGTAAFLLLVPQFNRIMPMPVAHMTANGPVPRGQSAGNAGELFLILPLTARWCWAKRGLSATRPTSTELLMNTALLGGR